VKTLDSRHYAGMAFALITACGLGAITTQAKIFYAAGGNALTLMLVRFLFSTLVFAGLLLARRQRFGVAGAQRWSLLSLGLVWSGAMICYLLSVEFISVSLAVLLLYLYPLLVLAHGLATRHLRPSPIVIGLFAGAFAGLYLALSGGPLKISVTGVSFALLASCGAAFTFIRGARVAPAMSPLLMTFWINAAGLALILPLMPGNLQLPDAAAGWQALSLASAFYLVAILSQFQALARLSAARAALLLNLEPVVSILLARQVLGEFLSPLQLIGVVLVIGAILLSLRIKPAAA
jgi:drug/metabolite transporter (DMT)-like permease